METSKLPKVRTSKGLKVYNLKGINLDGTIAGNSFYYKIGNYSSGKSFYKYLDIEAAIKCLKESTIRFAEPSSWKDNYESRYYRAIFDNVLNGKDEKTNCPRLFATCVTNKSDNEPSWVIYSYGEADKYCVQFTIDRRELRSQIIDFLNKRFPEEFTVYEGVVSYLWHGFIDNLYKETVNGEKNELHDLFFQDFSLKKYLNLLLLKRDAFEHEKETRIMIVPKKQDKKKYDKMGEKDPLNPNLLDVTIDWGSVIKYVKYDADCPEDKVEELKKEIKKISISRRNDISVRPYQVYGKLEQLTIN